MNAFYAGMVPRLARETARRVFRSVEDGSYIGYVLKACAAHVSWPADQPTLRFPPSLSET